MNKVCKVDSTRDSIDQENGFLLAEILVAILILAVGLLGVGTMLHVSMKNDRHNSRLRFAQMAAQEKIEEIKSIGTSKYLATGSERLSSRGNWVTTGFKDGYMVREWHIAPDPMSGVNLITVTVKWGKYEVSQLSYSK